MTVPFNQPGVPGYYPGYNPQKVYPYPGQIGYVPQARGWICPVCEAGVAPSVTEHCKPAALVTGVSTTTAGQINITMPTDPNIRTYNEDCDNDV